MFLLPQTDGERLPLSVKDLGSSDIYPQSLQHSPNGRFVTGKPHIAYLDGLEGAQTTTTLLRRQACVLLCTINRCWPCTSNETNMPVCSVR